MKTLKALRKIHGDTQTQLASKLGVIQQTIARWEKGVTEPSIKQIKALATQYNVTTDILLEHEPSAALVGTLSHIWMEQLMVKNPITNEDMYAKDIAQRLEQL